MANNHLKDVLVYIEQVKTLIQKIELLVKLASLETSPVETETTIFKQERAGVPVELLSKDKVPDLMNRGLKIENKHFTELEKINNGEVIQAQPAEEPKVLEQETEDDEELEDEEDDEPSDSRDTTEEDIDEEIEDEIPTGTVCRRTPLVKHKTKRFFDDSGIAVGDVSFGNAPKEVLEKRKSSRNRKPAREVKLRCDSCGTQVKIDSSMAPRRIAKEDSPRYVCDRCIGAKRGG